MCGFCSSAFSSAIACLEAFFGLAILQACASPSDLTVRLCTRVSAFRIFLSLLFGFSLSVLSTGVHRCRENSLVAWIRSNSRVSACERPCGGLDSGNRHAQTLHSYSPAVFLGISAAKPCRESSLDFMGTVHLACSSLCPCYLCAQPASRLPIGSCSLWVTLRPLSGFFLFSYPACSSLFLRLFARRLFAMYRCAATGSAIPS